MSHNVFAKSKKEALNMYILQDALRTIGANPEITIIPIVNSQGLFIGVADANNQNRVSSCCPIHPNNLNVHAPFITNQCKAMQVVNGTSDDIANANQRLMHAKQQLTWKFDAPDTIWVRRNVVNDGPERKRLRISVNDFQPNHDEPMFWATLAK